MLTTPLIDAFLDPVAELLPVDTAQRLLDWKVDPQLQTELDDLATKASAGTLTDAEREQYSEYIAVLDWITLIKAKARAALRRKTP